MAPIVADPERLREEYLRLAAQERDLHERVRLLEAETSALRGASHRAKVELKDVRRRLREAHASLNAYRAENRRLKADLQRVRASTSMRVGRAVVKPGVILRRSVGRLSASLRPTSPTPPGPFDVPASTTGAPTSGTARTAATPAPPAVRPRSELSGEELVSRFVEGGAPDDLHAALSRLWYQEGHIRRPAGLVAEHADVIAALDPEAGLLARQIAAAGRVLERGWAVPPRSTGPVYLPERGRVMYCVHSTPVFDSNGYSIRTGGIAGGLRRNGVDVVAVARAGYPWDGPTGSGVPRKRTVRRLDGVDYVHNPARGLGASSLEEFLDEAADTVVREARLLRPATIHAASDAQTALPALVAARRLGVPFVYEVRGLWEVTAASTRPGWETSERYALQVALETLVATEADAVLAITSQVADVLVGRGVDRERIRVVPNAVDPELVLPLPRDASLRAAAAVRPDVPCIGFAGSIVAYEGLDVLVDAMRILLDRGHDAQVVIAGSGAAEADLRARVAELDLGESVHLLGRIPHDDVARLVSMFDVMVCPRPSLPITELVSPLKPLESFAAQKAVVLSDVAPHIDLAGPAQERALLARAGDPVSLADRLEELILDEDRRRELGRRARLWVGDERTWRIVCRGVVEAYAEAQTRSRALGRGRPLAGLRIGVIADEFTTRTLEGSVDVVPIDRERWPGQVDGLDLLLVESAWKGNCGQWHRGVGYYSDEDHADLAALIAACREAAVPVVFWNKEDPVHTQRFRKTAAMCDAVFTVDASLVPQYREWAAEGPNRAVAALPFFAQPLIHNPLPSDRPYEPTAAYAGTYYGERYPDRTQALSELLEGARSVGLAIYDRQLNEPDSPYSFPATLQPFVRGGLPYAEVLETYRSHLAHLNVNSVTESPTMFSRRVVEIAASGGVVLSGPARGIEECLGDAIPLAADRDDAAAWLRWWAEDGRARLEEAWRQMRAVHRAHTASAAMVLLARTAGIATAAEPFPSYGLVTEALTQTGVDAALRQSCLPALIQVTGAPPPRALATALRDAGIEVLEAGESPTGRVPWLGLLDDRAGRTYYEDLLLCTRFGAWNRLEPTEPTPDGSPGALVSLVVGAPRSSAGLVRADLLPAHGGLQAALLAEQHGALSVVFPTARPPATGPAGSSLAVRERPGVLLVAGHDLKFLEPAFPTIEAAGTKILVDAWSSHTDHEEEVSTELLSTADAVLCEWGLGNAVWYSNHVRPDQRLVVRVHSQELRTPHLRRMSHANVDAYVFVSELVRRAAIVSHGIPQDKTVVVPNMVDVDGLALPKLAEAAKTIGFVGMVPQTKRLDLALDVLEAVLREDPGYRLNVRGRRPEEYPWMLARPTEMAFYDEQFRRIDALQEVHPGSVVLTPQGDDMAEWYRGVGSVISVSDFESFHLTIAEGVASGARPAVLVWPGADLVYPRRWLASSVGEMAQLILRGDGGAQPSDVSRMARDLVATHLLDLVSRPRG
ncbi:glycosyltransferase [Cellulomonas carbonis]|uniref:glycosyltransferase n=1 Tax=Cellulomonas carbonis TaxID=1386092 RepID=UPI001376607F|nr:glycosyltransferase [Cellulomonas carbonis]